MAQTSGVTGHLNGVSAVNATTAWVVGNDVYGHSNSNLYGIVASSADQSIRAQTSIQQVSSGVAREYVLQCVTNRAQGADAG